ncbi:hypothetical protein EK21DRAFT_95628 [Setomelanomma holmii]|uniref:Uncharacterized protein n=1 Tax=Setomelanomma holmii TaxID=210430 RepID=A0A9P4GTA7_9PLEO|nr:hypothetical protein EK21DRAFT_95628 [Setomelanomma holmii]
MSDTKTSQDDVSTWLNDYERMMSQLGGNHITNGAMRDKYKSQEDRISVFCAFPPKIQLGLFDNITPKARGHILSRLIDISNVVDISNILTGASLLQKRDAEEVKPVEWKRESDKELYEILIEAARRLLDKDTPIDDSHEAKESRFDDARGVAEEEQPVVKMPVRWASKQWPSR